MYALEKKKKTVNCLGDFLFAKDTLKIYLDSKSACRRVKVVHSEISPDMLTGEQDTIINLSFSHTHTS